MFGIGYILLGEEVIKDVIVNWMRKICGGKLCDGYFLKIFLRFLYIGWIECEDRIDLN